MAKTSARAIVAPPREPLVLAGGRAWLVRDGAVDIYVTGSGDADDASPRQFAFRATAGQLIAGFSRPDPSDVSGGLIGVESIGTILDELDDDEWRRRWLARDAAVHQVVADWCRALFTLIETAERPEPGRPRLTRTVVAAEPVDVAAPSGMLWVTPREGEALLCGRASMTIPLGIVCPVHAPGWVRISGEADVVETADEITWDDARAGLTSVQTGIEQAASAALAERLSQRHRQRLARRDANGRATARALLDAAARVGHVRATVVPLDPASATAADDVLWMAANAVARESGVILRSPPALPPQATVATTLDAIARASRCRIRNVALGDDWRTADHGPLLVFTRESRAPLALIPSKPGRYRVHDPATGGVQPLTAALAETIEPRAWVFYRPFPARPLTITDILSATLRGCRRELLGVLIIGSLAGMLSSMVPLATGILVNSVIPSAEHSHLTEWILLLVACGVATGVFQLARAIVLIRLEMKTNTAMQAAVWDRLISLPMPFFRRYSTGDLSVRAGGIDQIRQAISGATLRTVLGGVFSIFNVAMLFFFSPVLAIGGLTLIAVAVATTCGVAYVQLSPLREASRLRAKASGMVLQLLTAVSKLRMASAEQRAFVRWADLFVAQRRLQAKARLLGNGYTVFNSTFPTMTLIVIFALAARAGDSGASLRTGDFIAFMSGFSACLAAALQMGSGVIAVLAVLPQYELAKPILDTAPETVSEKLEAPPLLGRIDLEHVTFRYAPDLPPVLDDVSLQIGAGEFVALVGPSGSGKSTLLRLLLGFDTPDSGVVCYDGQDLQTLDAGSVRRQLGVVMQSGRLVPGDLMTNIVGCTAATGKDAWAAARAAALEQDIKAMPMGMHTVITEGGGQISGGQRQRLLIARAVVARPRLIFFDEATSALDNATQSIVTRNLSALGATRVVVAHRLSTIVDADRIVVLDKGRIVEIGRYDALMARGGLFASLARRQQM